MLGKVFSVWFALCFAAEASFAADPYAQLVEDTYGARIAKARHTATDTDDMDLVKEMLPAAEDGQNNERLRLALAKKVLDLSLPLGSAEAVDAARRSVKIIDGIEPLNHIQRAALHKDLAIKALDRAREDGKKVSEIRQYAEQAIDAQLDYIEAALGDEESLGSLGAVFATVQRTMTSYRLLDRRQRYTDLREKWTTAQTRASRLRTAHAQLDKARESGNQDALRTARRALGNLHLTYDGDLLAAAEYLKDTQDPAEKTVLAAAAFLRDPKAVDKDTGLEVVEDLIAVTNRVQEGQARGRVVKCAYGMCAALVAADLGGVKQAKAKLLLVQLKKMAGDTNADRFRKQLAAAWGPIEGDLEVLDLKENRIRLTYDFASAKQANDWKTESGSWGVVKGLLGCESDGIGMSGHKLLFRSDQPLKVSFRASAAYQITLRLHAYQQGARLADYAYFMLYGYRVRAYAFRGEYWYDYSLKLRKGAVYQFEIESDGKGSFRFSINGKLLRTVKAALATAANKDTALSVHLVTMRAKNPPTAFDDVVIEGTVLPKPQK